MGGHHFEVIGVGKRSLAPQTKTTSLISIVLLGGIAIGTVDQAHVVMVNAFTEILDGESVIRQGDLDGTIRAACLDVSIPGVTQHFTYYGQALILVEGARQDVEELGTIGDAEFDGLLAEELTMREYYIRIIKHYLKKYNNKVTKVAEVLDVGKSSIYNLIKEEGIG